MSRYRIQAVVEMTGVAAATLRAWERRYGVPQPKRTSAAYRLYDDRDVQVIQRMRDLRAGGIAAAEAAKIIDGERPPSLTKGRGEVEGGEADAFALAADRIVQAAVDFDVERLEAEIARALALGSAIDVFERVLGPGLRRIGDLWHDGTITVAQEHVASQAVNAALTQLLRLVQPSGATRTALLACFAEEDHLIGLLGAGLVFASWGFRSVMVGARTPPSAIARAVEAIGPDLVALSATIAPPSAQARELVDAYADACRGTAWLVGGAGSEAMRAQVEARGGLVVGATMGADSRREVERRIAALRRRKKTKKPTRR